VTLCRVSVCRVSFLLIKKFDGIQQKLMKFNEIEQNVMILGDSK
jgi:hypothetical protein